MRSAKIAGLVVMASLAVAPSVQAQASAAIGRAAPAPHLTAGWHTEDFPGAMQTYVYGISSAGGLFGEYRSPSGLLHGFTEVGGIWTTIDDPVASSNGQTLTVGETTSGAIVGSA